MVLLYDKKDMIFGNSLYVWGQKFKRNTKQNFIKIEGSCGAEINKSLDQEEHIEKCKCDFPGYNHYFENGYGFDKRLNLIAEPEKNSDCPDYSGTDKHLAKRAGHTPATKYEVGSIGDIFAVCYIDSDRQKRKRFVRIPTYKTRDSFFKKEPKHQSLPP